MEICSYIFCYNAQFMRCKDRVMNWMLHKFSIPAIFINYFTPLKGSWTHLRLKCSCQRIMVKYSGSCQQAVVPLTSISRSELCPLFCCCCTEASVTVVTFCCLLFYVARLAVMDGWILKPSAAAINIIFQCVYFHKHLVTAVWAELYLIYFLSA